MWVRATGPTTAMGESTGIPKTPRKTLDPRDWDRRPSWATASGGAGAPHRFRGSRRMGSAHTLEGRRVHPPKARACGAHVALWGAARAWAQPGAVLSAWLYKPARNNPIKSAARGDTGVPLKSDGRGRRAPALDAERAPCLHESLGQLRAEEAVAAMEREQRQGGAAPGITPQGRLGLRRRRMEPAIGSAKGGNAGEVDKRPFAEIAVQVVGAECPRPRGGRLGRVPNFALALRLAQRCCCHGVEPSS